MGGPRLVLFKRFNTVPMHYFKLMGPKFWLTNFIHHAIWKEHIHGALKLHCSSYISKIVWWLPMFDFGIFCHLLRLMGIYRAGGPVRVFEKKISFTACVNKSASLKEHFFLGKLYVSFEKVNNYMIGNIISFYRIFVLCNLEVWFRNYGKSCEVPPNLFGLIH